MKMQDISVEVWEQNYKAPGESTVQDTWERLARAGSSVESEEMKEKVYQDFKWLFSDFRGIPGGRITANLGVPSRDATTLFNCFVHNPLDIGFNDPDSIEGIYSMLKAQAHTLKSEGGYGMNFSWMRPAGMYVHGIGGRTPGVLTFMNLWNASSAVITMGSDKILGDVVGDEKKKMRKGAQMGILEIWHPEIEDFIDAKLVQGRLDKFNLSVGVTNGFMEALQADEYWDLVYPVTTIPEYKTEWHGNLDIWKSKGLPVTVYKTIKASVLWEKLMKATYTRNDPGVLFLDLANKLNPLAYQEIIATTNPCQPKWAPVLTPKGISTIGDVSIGDVIWSKDGWTTIVNKWSTGIKRVNKYKTNSSVFYGTENHRILENGVKVEVKDATSIDTLTGLYKDDYVLNLQDVVDGLVIGDGTVHKASNNLVSLCIGKNDFDYFTSDISSFIGEHRPTLSGSKTNHLINTTITHDELPLTYLRKVPTRFKNDINSSVGFLRGLYSANGSVSGNRITLKQSSLELIEDVQMMLSAVGIRSYVTTTKPSTTKFTNGTYTNRVSYCLNISSDRGLFIKLIGFIQQYKNDKVNLVASNRVKKTYEIVDTTFISEEEVFDITVDNVSHTYWSGGCDVSNCGEIAMSTGVCNLLSLNLVKHIKKEGDVWVFDYESFKRAVGIAVRFSDNINDISRTPLPEYKASMTEKRRIGIGVLALGSLHYILGIRYGSQESIELIDNIFRAKAETEIITSAELGREKGSFLQFDSVQFYDTYWWKNIPISQEVKTYVESLGTMRNSHRSANAPTGNMSVYAEVVSGGIEPCFLKEYTRWSIVSEGARGELRNKGLIIPDIHKGEWFETDVFKSSKRGTDDILKGIFEDVEYEIDKNRGLIKASQVVDYGWLFVQEHMPEMIEEWDARGVFATTENLNVDDHVNTLEVIAKYTDMNSSKTINVPADYPYEGFQQLYTNAWKAGIKGITTYRAGTMTVVLEKKGEIAEQKEELENFFVGAGSDVIIEDVELPEEYYSKGYIIRDRNKKKWYVNIAFADAGLSKPFALFVNTNNIEGSEVTDQTITSLMDFARDKGIRDTLINDQIDKFHIQSNVTKIARTIGFLLRHNVQIIDIVNILDDGQYPLSSFPFHIKRLLKQFIKDGMKVTGKESDCPKCGGEMIFQEGCILCKDCSYSRCS